MRCPLGLDRQAALVTFFQRLDLLGENLHGDLVVLGAGARRLAFDHDAGGFVDHLDGGVGFVLLVWASAEYCLCRWLGGSEGRKEKERKERERER